MDNVPVEQVNKTKFLGVVINSKLNWNDHITTLCTQISKNTGIIFKVRHNLNKITLLLLYVFNHILTSTTLSGQHLIAITLKDFRKRAHLLNAHLHTPLPFLNT